MTRFGNVKRFCLILHLFCFWLVAAPVHGEDVLYVYTWKDYFDSDVINEFQKKYDCRVDMTYFASNEDLHRALVAGQGDFDIVTPSSYKSAALWKEGLLARLDHSKLPNLANLDARAAPATDDPDMVYSIPFTRTIYGVGYHRNHVRSEDLGGWEIFENPRYRKRMTMIDDMRGTMGAALKHLGYSVNATDDAELAEAAAVLERWKQNLSGVVDDSDWTIINESDRLASHAYNGDVALMIADDPNLGFYVPREGSSQVSDDFVIPLKSANRELAHAFINHMFDPEMARLNMEGVFFYMFVPEALENIDESLKNNPAFNIPDEAVARCEAIRDIGPAREKYRKIWKKIMK